MGLVIPISELKSEILVAIVEEFVLREGTDYGLQEYSLAEKVQHVLRQLQQGVAEVVFDEESKSCTIRVC